MSRMSETVTGELTVSACVAVPTRPVCGALMLSVGQAAPAAPVVILLHTVTVTDTGCGSAAAAARIGPEKVPPLTGTPSVAEPRRTTVAPETSDTYALSFTMLVDVHVTVSVWPM